MTSHELGGLAGNQRTLLYTQQHAAGGRRHDCHLESIKNPTMLIDRGNVYLLEEQFRQILSRSDLRTDRTKNSVILN